MLKFKVSFIWMLLIFKSSWGVAACPSANTKFKVYTNVGVYGAYAVPTSEQLYYSILNKKIIAEKSMLMFEMDDIAFPIPIAAVQPVFISYVRSLSQYAYSPLGTLKPPTSPSYPLKYIYPDSTLQQTDNSPIGNLAAYKTQMLNVDLVGEGCSSVLFTTSQLILAPAQWQANYGNFILGFDRAGNAVRLIELDARFGENANLGLSNSGSSVEILDIDGDGSLDLLIRQGGLVSYAFQGIGYGAIRNFQIDPNNREVQVALALQQTWKEFIQLASNQNPRANLYFSSQFVAKYSEAMNAPNFLLRFSEGLLDSGAVKAATDSATYAVLYATPIGNALEMIDFVRENGVWKLNDF